MALGKVVGGVGLVLGTTDAVGAAAKGKGTVGVVVGGLISPRVPTVGGRWSDTREYGGVFRGSGGSSVLAGAFEVLAAIFGMLPEALVNSDTTEMPEMPSEASTYSPLLADGGGRTWDLVC